MPARLRQVKNAYSNSRHESGPAAKSSGYSRFFMISFVAIIFVFFLSLSKDGGNYNDDNLRSGQAHHHVAAINGSSSSSGNEFGDDYDSKLNSMYGNDGDGSETMTEEDETEIEQTIDDVIEDIEDAKDEIIDAEFDRGSMLSNALSSINKKVRSGMNNFLREEDLTDAFTEEEVEEIEEQIETAIDQGVDFELRTAADEIVKEQISIVEGNVDIEASSGVDALDIEEDIYNNEEEAFESVRAGIDSAAVEVKNHIQSKAAQIEKEILEDRLSEKLGYKVKLLVVDDDMDMEIDRMIDDLPSLKTSSNNNPTTSSSGAGATDSSSYGERDSTLDSSSTGGTYSSISGYGGAEEEESVGEALTESSGFTSEEASSGEEEESTTEWASYGSYTATNDNETAIENLEEEFEEDQYEDDQN